MMLQLNIYGVQLIIYMNCDHNWVFSKFIILISADR